MSEEIVADTQLYRCWHFQRGQCTKGDECEYVHDHLVPARAPVCVFFTRGYCKAGMKCLFYHDYDDYEAQSWRAKENENEKKKKQQQQTDGGWQTQKKKKGKKYQKKQSEQEFINDDYDEDGEEEKQEEKDMLETVNKFACLDLEPTEKPKQEKKKTLVTDAWF